MKTVRVMMGSLQLHQAESRCGCSSLMGCVWLCVRGGLRNLESRAVKAAEINRGEEQLATYSKENTNCRNVKAKDSWGRERKRESLGA